MPDYPCSYLGCDHIISGEEPAIVVELIKVHALSHTTSAPQQPGSDTQRQKPPKLLRPSISKGITEEEWNTVSRKWDIFKNGTNIPEDQLSTQLWQCCDEELTSDLFRDIPNISTIDVDSLLQSIKQLAVLSVATCVRKTELLALHQDRGQPIRSFAARVKGKAQTCAFTKPCGTPTCTQNVDYSEDIVKHVVLAGIVDEEIKREVLGLQNLDQQSLNETITLIESKEMAARAMSATIPNSASNSNNVSAAHNKSPATTNSALRTKLSQKTNCKKCNVSMHKYKQFKPRKGPPTLREFELCKECWDAEHKLANKDSSSSSTTGAIFDQLSAVWTDGNTPTTETADSQPTQRAQLSSSFISSCDEILLESKSAISSAIQLLSASTTTIASECETLLNTSQSLMQQLSDQLMEIPGLLQSRQGDQPDSPLGSQLNQMSDLASADPPNLDSAQHAPPSPPLPPGKTVAAITNVVLDHHIFDGTSGWRRAESRAQPSLQLDLSVSSSDYGHLGIPCPKVRPSSTSVITDTGAQSSLMGYKLFRRAGFRDSALIPVTRRMYAANNEGIRILGAILLRLSGKDSTGHEYETAEMVYISDSTDFFYLSRHAMEQLQIIGPNFPSVGAAALPAHPPPGVHSVSTPASPENHCLFEKAECGCYLRSAPPPRPKELPFPPTVENIPAMRDWLLNKHFPASVFNKCTHQRMPFMDGPPLAVHINESADGDNTACHTPAMTPIHWHDTAEERLAQYVDLGIIEKVDLNVETKWCHRGFWTRKADGSPRLVVDLQKLNKHCTRSVHHTVPPFQQARRITSNTYRTVIDAWNGYYSVLLREEDRHLFTFSTEFGLFRFRVAPQGFIGSGDGYTDRYDRIIADTPRKTKCVDDTALWDDELEEHWWRIIDHLELLGRSGITLNPEKLQFCQREIDFAGFRVTETEVKPLPKYLNAIKEFPRPQNIKDVRAWFGLINQVSHYGQLTEIMAPFKPLLSPKTKFFWSVDLEDAFQASKRKLIEAIQHGVQIFDPSRLTCLTPDWSKKGIAYWLRQKYCDCDSEKPDCCPSGWKITLAGSRFLKDAEQRYAPVEGEALAIAWALLDTKYFTLGCDDLVITSDHRPLTKVFGDKALDEFTSERLFNLRRRTSKWRYKVVHVPGKTIPAADAASRYPSSEEDPSLPDFESDPDLDFLAALRIECEDEDLEHSIIASARSNLNDIQAVTWDRVKQETRSDTHLTQLMQYIVQGFPTNCTDLPLPLQPYWCHRNKLSIVDDVIMFDNRVLIPPTLRQEVLDSLHSAHQGVTGMGNRARATVFWSDISSALQTTRDSCEPCDRIAPSQPFQPPVPPMVPTMPFEAIAADYFELGGYYYLLSVDRFSNWPEVKQIKKSENNSGSSGLIKALKHLFAGFGVPMELSSDGGPEFKSHILNDFLSRWGVHHRQSSAYHPRSNGRAEVAVKAMKRLLQDNVGVNGEIDSDRYTQAILQFRNTPDSDSGLSPSEVLFGRPLRDILPIPPRTQIFDNHRVRPLWKEIWEQKEDALRTRFGKQVESLSAKTRDLQPLSVGDTCRVQNQTGHHPTKWDRTGVVLQINDNNQYLIKMHGSGRITLRNRKFLRKIQPLTTTNTYVPPQLPTLKPTAGQVASPPIICTPAETSDDDENVHPTITSGTASVPPDASADPPRGPPADNTHNDLDPSLVGTTTEDPTHQTPPTPPPRSTRSRRPPAWHADYKMER